MFDTGTGDINGKGRKSFDVLFRVSIKPEPITDIVITHGHLDYIRGLEVTNLLFPTQLFI